MLLICAVLLGAFIWFFERDGETSHQRNQRTRTVFSVYPESIVSIQMERDGVQIECSKAGGSWRLVQPTDAPVDTGIVQKMIAGMSRVERGERIEAETLQERGLTPADYGFDTPRARITFQNNRGTFTWLIGRDAPLGDMLYIMPEEGGDIIATSKSLLNLIPEDAAWIRDRTLFHDQVAAVRGIDLRRPAGFLQMRQPENNNWLMQQPHKGRADLLSVHALIEKIFSAKIIEFITNEKADLTVYGLEEPTYELTLFTLDEQTQTLRIGKTHPDHPEARYAKWVESDSVFTVSSEWVSLLDLEEDQLRSRHILGVLPARISEIRLTHNELQVALVQTNGAWQITRPARWNAEPSQVHELLQTLAQAVVLDFVDNPSAEQSQLMADAPWAITFSANGETHTLRISAVNSDGFRLVRRDEEAALYTTASDIINNAFAAPLFFRSRIVLEIDPTQISKITQQSDGEETVAQSTGTSFAAADRAQQLDSQALFDMTSELISLRAARYVAFNPDSLKSYGLVTPQFRVTVSLNGTNAIGRVVLLGDATEGGRFAMVQGQAIVFVLADETAQALTRKLALPLEKQTEEIERP